MRRAAMTMLVAIRQIVREHPAVQPKQYENVKTALALINGLPTMNELDAVDDESEDFAVYYEKLRADVASPVLWYSA